VRPNTAPPAPPCQARPHDFATGTNLLTLCKRAHPAGTALLALAAMVNASCALAPVEAHVSPDPSGGRVLWHGNQTFELRATSARDARKLIEPFLEALPVNGL
jgi:hypothetical protein